MVIVSRTCIGEEGQITRGDKFEGVNIWKAESNGLFRGLESGAKEFKGKKLIRKNHRASR